ncbi:hypothetical protein H2201_003334 [Coniosporium apollinis]|uniref:HNH domain-containing protein n=1 Tax=Coniosporium apollinis TaxID=61459 RepID=A0ABQ9P1Z3_9PEZI|nr:hypothetical protein H2201_003334 [Coniosporium apollinis]
MIPPEELSNYETFRECLSDVLIRKLTTKPSKPARRRAAKGRKNAIKPVNAAASEEEQSASDAEDLGDFIDYLSSEIFTSLPPELRLLSYTALQNDTALRERYTDPLATSTLEVLTSTLPPSVPDSLLAYSLLPDATSLPTFLSVPLSSYIAAVTAPPPVWSNTRASACEICERDWIPLTYHHLIPKSVHERVLKRGWHDESVLNSVAWLCRACHSFVHGIAGNEELAKDWYTVERLRGREDVQRWARWVGRVRWKAR